MVPAPATLIVALATPPGRGALALVRLAGAGSIELVARLSRRATFEPRVATLARLHLPDDLVETALVTTFVAPHSFTGQDAAEISTHGSPVIVEALLRVCLEGGARMARPGEFTWRAYLNGRLDLLQAEAVADLVAATTPAQVRVASAHLEGALSDEIRRVEQAISDEEARVLAARVASAEADRRRTLILLLIGTVAAIAAALFANLAGPFDVTVTDGTVLGVDVWYEIERAMAVAQTRAPTADVVNHGRTEFSRFAARGTLRGRALQNDRMEFLTAFARVEGRGRVDYGDNRLDLDLTARLLKTPSGRLFGMKASRLQDAPIPLDVGGTLQEPKVRPDVSKLLQAVAKDTLKQPLEEKVKKELEKLLKF